MALKNILDKVETASENKELSEVEIMRRNIMTSSTVKQVVLGSVHDGPVIPALYDPVANVFYPVFKEDE